MPSCLITGATGFLGRHACTAFTDRGWSVHQVVRGLGRTPTPGIHPTDGSFSSLRQIVSGVSPDVIVHLAASYKRDHRADEIEEMIQSNVVFGTHLLEAASKCECRRVVVSGTAWQHFDPSEQGYSPANLYAATKQAFEDIAKFYAQAYGFNITSLHFGDIYGPDDDRDNVFNLLRLQVRSHQPMELSPGLQLLDPLFVTDATNVLVLAAERLFAPTWHGLEVFSALPGNPVQLRQIIQSWCNIHQVNPAMVWGARPYRAREVMRTWTGGNWLPGWAPSIGLEEGLRLLKPA